MLWLCIELPHLSVESFGDAKTSERPLIISEAGTVIDCNHQALRYGIKIGMTPAAAHALAEGLHHHPRAMQNEQKRLEQLATWAGQFTSRVSLHPPSALMLEIGASLHYFHGLEPLRQQIAKGLHKLGHRAMMGIAPTPTAARLMARSGKTKPIMQRSELADALATLPVDVLELDHRQTLALQGLGCRCIGDIRALPAAGALRRLGKALIHSLQKAYGERPDPRADWTPPAQFCSDIQFLDPVTNVQQLYPGMRQLIETLCADLRRRDAGVMRLRFTLSQQGSETLPLTLGMIRPCRDPKHMCLLLERRLERLSIKDGVLGMTLRAGRFYAMQGSSERLDLISDDAVNEPNITWEPLVEALDNRLGSDCVKTLATRSEHRPERAWRYIRPGAEQTNQHQPSQAPAPRPFWLLPHPRPLRCRQGRPMYHGALILEHGPERIESGWWDGGDVARDYYQARNRQGQKLWVFRERRGERGWYLHGIFA